MALSISTPSLSDSTTTAPPLSHTYLSLRRRPSNSVHFLNFSPSTLPPCLCRASNSQPGPLPKQSSSTASKKRKKKGGKGDSKGFNPSDIEIVDDFSVDVAGPSSSTSDSGYLSYHPTTLPNPPAGFVLDDHGKVLMASNKRIATMVRFLFPVPSWRICNPFFFLILFEASRIENEMQK